jgi:hypothetical protein
VTVVVNMIPAVFSGESNQDSEPNLAVDPADPRRIVGSAFTPDPLGGANAPVFVSNDGGQTWTLNLIVPSTAAAATGDITVAFGHDGRLYTGILRRPGGLRLNILRTTNVNSPALMTVLVDRTGSGVDQPYVEAARVMRGAGVGNDRVFVGNNDFNGAAGRTATVDVSLDGAAAAPPPPANFVARRIEVRATGGQDLPPVRPAVHIDGTIYAAFIARRAGGTSDIVVVRDDDWAAGATQFAALTDSGDGLAGQRVVTGINVPFENFQTMGMERLVSSDLSIAVDPTNSSRVYVAWGDRPPGTSNLTLHVRRSLNRGQTWSAADLRTVSNAKAPTLAINSRGRVAFAYQQLSGPAAALRWVTQMEQTSDAFVTVATTVLATVPANVPVPTFLPYLGDYMDLKSVGKDFYGIFSAANTPNNANFPSGVQYQRNADFGTQTLLANDGVTPVPVSIDPFFYRVETVAANADFYVADWTTGATTFDLGVEPSIEPVFYAFSDVWTRRSNAPGGFDGNNRPINEDPTNGVGPGGDNFAFARVRRRGSGVTGSVSTHFLVSEFGCGSNYQDAGTAADITVNFAASDEVLTMSAGYPWHLDETTSTHLCLAVELDSPGDPIVPPSLLGRAPGWPTTDLLVINDNNKAQRNMGVGPTAVGGWLTQFAIIHNAATFVRDIVVRWTVLGTHEPSELDRLEVIGSRARPRALRGEGEVVLARLQPGENRWLGVTLESAKEQSDSLVVFEEIVDGVAVNGFAIQAVPVSRDESARHVLDRCGSVFSRLGALLESNEWRDLAAKARSLVVDQADASEHAAFLADVNDRTTEAVAQLSERLGGDPFRLRAAVKALTEALNDRNLVRRHSLHKSLLERIDASLTMLAKRAGDTADVAQNARWQADLLATDQLSSVRGAEARRKACQDFDNDFGARNTSSENYPELVEVLLPVLRSAARKLQDAKLTEAVDALDPTADPATVQAGHRDILLRLDALVR